MASNLSCELNTTALTALNKLIEMSGVSKTRLLESLLTREYDEVMRGDHPPVYPR